MKSQLAQDTTKSAKTLAQAVAKQLAREPFEIINDVKEQTLGVESSRSTDAKSPEPQNDVQKQKIEESQKLQDKMKGTRLMEAYQRELDDIRKQDLFKDLQKRISEGEEVPLEDFPELSMEQKQVLMAQMEAVRIQKSQAKTARIEEVPAIRSKPSRRFGAGQKTEAEKQQTRVEKPVPPSG